MTRGRMVEERWCPRRHAFNYDILEQTEPEKIKRTRRYVQNWRLDDEAERRWSVGHKKFLNGKIWSRKIG